jgi:hypothetical protein
MNPSAQVVSGYYVWELPGKPVVVHLNLNIIDPLSAEVMRGFGAVPKRGAEVGGVLFGTIEEGSPAVVRVENFEMVACQYGRGPSYLFTEEDAANYEEVAAKPGAIGYFRSHTREGTALGEEDIELLDGLYPGPHAVAMLIKPFATKVSTAAFFVRENGLFSTESALMEFPLRRRELTGGAAPERRPMTDRSNRPSRRRENESFDFVKPAEMRDAAPSSVYAPTPVYAPQENRTSQAAYAYQPPERPAARNRMAWIPLSFVFLLLGLFLGFWGSMMMGPKTTGAAAQPFTLSLSVAESGENLSVKWDRASEAVRVSKRGVLEIDEGRNSKPVELDAAQLQNGTLIYRTDANTVRFKLSVFPAERVTISESVEWKR